MFKVIAEMATASNEKSATFVPGMLPTVTIENGIATAAAPLRHATDVPDVQPEVRQSINPINTEAVGNTAPKLSPPTVTEANPDSGTFLIALETEGESKVKA